MERGKKINDKYDVIQESLSIISQLDFVDLKFKPQTRSNKINFLTDKVEVLTDYNSIDIIEWADVVIGNYSSILIEAVIQNKILISPLYHKSKETLLETFGVCLKVDSNEEIIELLRNIHHKGLEKYKCTNRNNFLNYVSHYSKDVLRDYINLINLIVDSK